MPTVKLEPVTRIESHGKLTVEFDDQGAPLRAYFSTPILRGFEAFMRGSPIERVPWFASRICGVCPVSHAVNAAQTVEKALSVQISETADILREMLVLSQLIDSHALSFAILSLPDLVPIPNIHSIVEIKQHFPDLFTKGLRLRTIGRQLTIKMGGRNVHPINVRVGGMSVNPLLEQDLNIPELLQEARSITQEFLNHCKQWFAEKQELITSVGSIPSNYMALSNNDTISFVKGTVKVISADGSDFSAFGPEQYAEQLAETIEPHTFMKLPYLRPKGVEEGLLRVNCLARANVNKRFGTPIADHELQELKNAWGGPLEHSLLSHWARLIELIYATERLEELFAHPASIGQETAVPIENLSGEAVGCLEAPRGTLFHHYRIEDGQISMANYLVATQNNGLAVNKALSETVKIAKAKGLDEAEAKHRCEMVIRAYDPCISCSTHVLKP